MGIIDVNTFRKREVIGMEQRRFGDSDLFSSAIGFGTWELSTTQYGEIDVRAASDAVAAAIDHGITLFDTAEGYGPYHSEELLGKALGARRKEIVLVTKVGFTFADGRIAGRCSEYDYIIERAEGCLDAPEHRLHRPAAGALARPQHAL